MYCVASDEVRLGACLIHTIDALETLLASTDRVLWVHAAYSAWISRQPLQMATHATRNSCTTVLDMSETSPKMQLVG
jgi:hypothetical protein